MLFALGFLFLFTVGGLNNLLVLPLKITICWELLTMILLIILIIICPAYGRGYLRIGGILPSSRMGRELTGQNIILLIIIVKMYYFEQSAGNLNKGSSETTRNPRNKFISRRYSPLNRNFIRFYSLKKDNTKNLNPLISYNCLKDDRFTILKAVSYTHLRAHETNS